MSRMTWRPPATTPTITGLVAIALALVLGAFAAGAQAAPPEQFQMIDLGTLGGPGPAAALAVNSSGQVVGSSSTSDPVPERHAFMWTQSEGMTDLGTLGGDFSAATDVNELGQVVGNSDIPDGRTHGFSWTQAEGMVDFGTLGGAYSYAFDVNDNGQATGQSSTASDDDHAYSWTQGGGMVDLGTLGGSISRAFSINGHGQIAGDSSTEDGDLHAFSWTQSGGMADLGTLGGSNSGAAAVNDSGQVVGSAELVDGPRHAFSWTQAGGMVDLGTLGGASEARDVNENGQIVGYSFNADGVLRAVLWNPILHVAVSVSGKGRFNTERNGQVLFTLSNDSVSFDRTRGERFSFAGEVASVTGSANEATLTGTGTWNGKSGYAVEVSAVDTAAWGRLEDTIDVVIRDPEGGIAFTSLGPQLLKQGDIVVTSASS